MAGNLVAGGAIQNPETKRRPAAERNGRQEMASRQSVQAIRAAVPENAEQAEKGRI